MTTFTLLFVASALISGEVRTRDLAGTYLRGDGLGDSLSLTIQSSGAYSARTAGDIGPSETVTGRVVAESTHFRFVSSAATGALDGRWHPVRWGTRMYLLEEREMLEFANAVNLGVEPRKTELGSFLLRRFKGAGHTAGPPELPSPWAKLILKAPLVGAVKQLRTDGMVEIDLGATDSVFVGMLLSAQFPDGTGADLTVVEVHEKTSLARGSSPRLQVGTPVTSRQ